LEHSAFRQFVAQHRAIFSRCAVAAIVCALRHLLRVIALSFAGDPDVGRACRASGRVVRRGWNASPCVAIGRGGDAPGSEVPLRDRSDADPHQGRPSQRRADCRRRLLRGRCGRLQRGHQRTCRRATRRRCHGQRRRHTAGAPLVVRRHLESGGAHIGIRTGASFGIFQRRLSGRVRRHISASSPARGAYDLHLCPGSTRPGRRGDCAAARRVRGAIAVSGECAADRRFSFFSTFGDRRMRKPGIRIAGEIRSDRPPPSGCDGDDHARGFQPFVPATGGALYGPASHGWRASFKRPGSRSQVRGLYLAGGSAHPGPGVPMAATSGRLAAACILADYASIAR